MANKRYSEKESPKGGMKNNDGREMGSAFDADNAPGKISPKEVVDPNASVSPIAHQPGVEGGH